MYLLSYLYLVAKEFNKICEQKSCHKVGIVGEIFLKFNPFAQKDITSWLINQQIEVIPPLMTDFFMQGFVNLKVRQNEHLQRKNTPDFVIDWLYKKVQKQINKVNEIGKSFDYFAPFEPTANHIVQKGVEKRIKSLYPQMNILSLDFDSSVSDVNITNRLLLFIDNISN